MNDAPTPRFDAIVPTQGRKRTMLEYIEELEALARQLERELAAERALPANLLDVNAICDQRDKAVEDLQRERALADRLAGCIERMPWIYGIGEREEAEESLAEWKGARNAKV